MERVGLIPCAGEGSRLGLPFSKEMFPDLHYPTFRPIIMYTIEAMQKAGIKQIIFTINPKKIDLLTFLGNGDKFEMGFTYCIHPEPRSLPESINEAYYLTKDKIVVFAMPDTCVKPTDYLNILLKVHLANFERVATLACFKTENPAKFGMVEFQDNLILDIIDKPDSTKLQWMWGAMIWSPEVTEAIKEFVNNKKGSSSKEIILTDALIPLI